MFSLEAQVAAIKQQLATIEALETCSFIDQDEQTRRYPAKMPAAFVLLEKLKIDHQNSGSMVAQISWSVVVMARQLQGTGGCLAISDLVADAMGGFVPAVGCTPLVPVSMQLLEQRGESLEYVVTFTTTMQALLKRSS